MELEDIVNEEMLTVEDVNEMLEHNAIEGWKQHGTQRFGKEYGIQRSWK